jgi:bifunctional UDP-N-acetylglucosamine pyrophosphorylase/glucosamine-1-phosphate N-acetyltransferase
LTASIAVKPETGVALNVVILAAGMGKRMRSELPKVLHPLAGRPMLAHVLHTARALVSELASELAGAPGRVRLIGVYGHGGALVPESFVAPDLIWVEQSPQRGTGHAVMQAAPHLLDQAPTLVLYGDVPLIDVATLARLTRATLSGSDAAQASLGASTQASALAAKPRFGLLTVDLAEPTGYGRVVRGAAPGCAVQRIVEQRDAGPAELAIREVNTGVMVAPTGHLRRWLNALSNDNAQGEYYLTDIVGMAVADGLEVITVQPAHAWETLGVNSRAQLAELERVYQRGIAERLMDEGVHLLDPARIDVRGELRVGRDVSIDVGCIFEGRVVLGDGVRVGPYCVLRDAQVGAGVEIAAFSHLEGARVGAQARIGPFARLRPGTELGVRAHVGNFVEVKNSQMGADAKANHLAYVGDSTVGERVNIGAGTITCNYDGANKHRTVIEDDVFIGSNSALVAPVRVGRGATLGAGTTLTRDAPPGALVVSRAPVRTVAGWVRPSKTDKGLAANATDEPPPPTAQRANSNP